ncbi:MAG: translation initiation factor IF-2 [candidate division Zixibacteria bacterium]|nr:translation initiation factor IF-2 [candidate division Zixibacteria bacterium]
MKRIYELAKEYKVSSHAMLKIVQELGYTPKSHMSVAPPDMINAVSLKFAQEKMEAKREMQARLKAAKEKEAKDKAAREKAAKEKAEAARVIREKEAADKAAREKAAKPKDTAPKEKVVRPEVKPVRPIRRLEPAPLPKPKSKQRTAPAAEAPEFPPSLPPTKPPRGPAAAGTPKAGDKKKKKKERRKKKDRREVDRAEVAKSFRATMANLSTKKTKRKYKRSAQGEDGMPDEAMNVVDVNEYVSVAELSKLLDRKPAELVAKLLELGMMATINQRLDMDTIEMIAAEFDYEVNFRAEVGEEAMQEEVGDNLETRAPVVTVMGHVDHGKTSLLDYIRKTNVVAGEAGAITQHIGAYEVQHNDKKIVFLDTPGHEAFTAMRARGTQITDIIVLIVAADEGVRPQTIEAIDHGRAANVPIVVAISKIDKPGANVDEIKTQLANLNLLPEDWGGKTIMVGISSKSGEGVERLLEMILLQAEMMDLVADPLIRGQGVIVDSRLEKGRGPVATVLIQRGTCKVGDPIVAGVYSGHVRTIVNDRDQRIEQVGPSTPAQITGLSGVPQAGDSFLATKDDHEAREIVVKRSMVKREYESRRPQGAVTLERVFDQIQEGQIKEVRLVIKGDVDGSVEVLCDTLGKIATDEVKTNIIRRGVGSITESDVLLAAASDAIIIGFQVTVESRARDLAKQEKVDIRSYSIIYEAEDDVKKALEGLLAPKRTEKFVGLAEVRETFKVPKIGLIAGSYIKEGRIARKDSIRLTRDGKVIFTGTLSSLRRFKDDAREVKEGFECGIGIENFNDVKVGDLIEAFEIVETARTLSS